MENHSAQSASSTLVAKRSAYPELIEPRVSLEGTDLGGSQDQNTLPSVPWDSLLAIECLRLWEEH